MFKIVRKEIVWGGKKLSIESGPINWDEFWEVVKGNGPCNKERVDDRRKAKEDGAWVREAALAHAKKRKDRSQLVSAAS